MNIDKSNTKLAINLSEGTVQVEGDEAFVRFIYEDFRDSLSKRVIAKVVTPPVLEHQTQPLLTNENKRAQRAELPKKRSARQPAAGGSGGAEKVRKVLDKPNYNPKLNVTGLPEFYDKWKPQNVPEQILVFAVFLRDTLQMPRCNADDIFTCFFAMKAKTKIPEAFHQAFLNTKARTHYIEFETTDSIEVTIAGDNWFTAQEKKLKEQSK
jgi:hypothetical protein